MELDYLLCQRPEPSSVLGGGNSQLSIRLSLPQCR